MIGHSSDMPGHDMPGHDMPGHDMPGHDMPDMPQMCKMNMLFTWDYNNVCVIFKWWHIRSFVSFLLSFLAIVALTAGYEFLRYWINIWEQRNISIINGTSNGTNSQSINNYKTKKSILYGFQIGYSFLLMLVFMTYNGWLMLAVVIGAILGNRVWGSTYEIKGLQCH